MDRAYQWYRRAYDLGKSDSPVYWGSAALRLGKAHDEGEDCTQSFQEAKGWYSRAVAGLSAEVVEKLAETRPHTLGQAGRISGVTPAAVGCLQVQLKKLGLL